MSATEEEMYLRLQLAEIHKAYQLQAKPYIDRLVEIELSKPPKPMFICFPENAELPQFVREMLASQPDTEKK